MTHDTFTRAVAKGLHVFFIAALAAGLVASLWPVQTAYGAASAPVSDPSSGMKRTITVQALIDGRSQLILNGHTAQWLHLDFAAPGRLEGRNDPTIINGKEWFPVWPDVPDAENRFCNCYSSIFRDVTPALPQTDMTVALEVIQGRGDIRIIQMPDARNNHNLIVEFDDNAYCGAVIYQIELDISFDGKQ